MKFVSFTKNVANTTGNIVFAITSIVTYILIARLSIYLIANIDVFTGVVLLSLVLGVPILMLALGLVKRPWINPTREEMAQTIEGGSNLIHALYCKQYDLVLAVEEAGRILTRTQQELDRTLTVGPELKKDIQTAIGKIGDVLQSIERRED